VGPTNRIFAFGRNPVDEVVTQNASAIDQWIVAGQYSRIAPMTIQRTRLRGGRCATEFEDLRGNLERNRSDNLLGLIHLRIQRIDSCCCRPLPSGIRSKMFDEYRRDSTEDCINAGRLGVEFPYQLQHLWVIGDDVGCSMAEGSSTGLHI